MVIPDPFSFNSRSTRRTNRGLLNAHEMESLAAPLDRLAAALCDYLLIIPGLTLILAPWKRLLERSLITGNGLLLSLQIPGSILLLLITVICYQTVFVYFLNGTPGKLLLKLRVISLWENRRVSLSAAFFRSLVWLLDLVTLLPLLALFFDTKRRPWHDRVSDTCVVATRWRGVDEPGIVERGISRGLFHGILTFGLISALVVSSQFALELKQQSQSAIGSVDDTVCPLGKSKHPVTFSDQTKRALSLFIAHAMSSRCLKSYAHVDLTHNEFSGLGYLAMAFAFSHNHPRRSRAYLKKVCEVDSHSESCEMSRAVWDERIGDWEMASRRLHQDLQGSDEFVKLWAVKHFFKVYDDREVLHILQSGIVDPELAEFVLTYRMKSLWNSGQQKQAQLLFEANMDYLGKRQGMDSSQWICTEELVSGCPDNQDVGCETFYREIHRKRSLFALTTAQALTDYKLSVCWAPNKFDFDSVYVRHLPKLARLYLHSWKLRSDGHRKRARRELEELASLRSASFAVTEARLDLINLAKSPAELEFVKEFWEKQNQFASGWAPVGLALMKAAESHNSMDLAFQVGSRLNKAHMRNEPFLHDFALVSFEDRHFDTSFDVWRNLTKAQINETPQSSDRRPASATDPLSDKAFEAWIHSQLGSM